MSLLWWGLAGLLTAAVALGLLWPGRRRTLRGADDAAAAMLRAQLDQIASDAANGVIAPDAAEAAHRETARRLLAVTGRPDAENPPEKQESWLRLAVAAILLPGLALFLYIGIGRPDLIGQPPQPAEMRAEVPPPTGAAPALSAEQQAAFAELSEADRDAMITAMVDGLAARLAETPDDFEGWLRLARARQVLGDGDAVAAALAGAEAAAGEDFDRLMQLADAHVALAGFEPDQLGPGFLALTRRLVTAAPDDLQAVYLRGLGHAAAGNVDAARTDWSRVLAAMEPGTPAHDTLAADIAALAD